MTGVSKCYGSQAVLDEIDLTIHAAEVFALLGPNGAGKTTAVEILEGYRRADSGRVSVLGFDPAAGGAELRSRIGIVLQQTTAFERSTVRETVEMFAGLFPNAMAVDDAIELVDLGDHSGRIADTMSGGQRRRLDVACGLVGRPDVLFLDEPTTGLDPEARRTMWRIIADLRDSGTTVVLTTHYLDEAEALADRIGILLDGRLLEVAEPARIGGRDAGVARVRFRMPVDAAREFAGWDFDGATVSAETAEPARVVADLVARHGELADLTVTRPSLEDVYLDMIERSEVAR